MTAPTTRDRAEPLTDEEIAAQLAGIEWLREQNAATVTVEAEDYLRLLATLALVPELRRAIDNALLNLECAMDPMWCFTRATKEPVCPCDNCKSWRQLSEALPVSEPAARAPQPETPP